MIVRFNGRAPQPQSFRLANQGNNNVDTVQFQLPLFDGAAAFLHLGIGKYSDIVPLNDGVYVATRTHTQHAGRMECWIEILADGDRVWRSDVFVMTIGHIPDAGQRIEQQYPTAIEEALRAVDTLTGVDARAETLPPGSEATVRFEEDAEGNRTIVYGIPRGSGGAGSGENGATFLPHVSTDGVISWTNDRGLANPAPVSIKGIPGKKGDDGFSPTISTEAVAGGYRLTIENPNYSYHSVIIRNGTAPSVQVNEITGGNRVTITGGNGAQTFDVLNGKDGNDVTGGGVEAALGYTPANAASVVQHTSQTLTEAQKTQARENIGAEKAAAKYELIETITCDGTFGNVSRSGLALRKAKIYLHTTAAVSAASIVAEINNVAGFFGYAWIGNAINTADRWTSINVVSDGEYAYVEHTVPAPQVYGTGAVSRTVGRYSGETPITRINMYASAGMIPTGSIIEIWGVRA